jgi:transcriptional regulator with XRE-family HTH domain
MAEIAHSIGLNLPEKLKDREYRQKFFLAESSAQIAAQLIALRKRRELNQHQLADLINTKQPAISRIEKADYQSWSFSILRKIAGVLDARIRVLIEPSEDILGEYESEQQSDQSETIQGDLAVATAILPTQPVQSESEHVIPRFLLPNAPFRYITPNFDVLLQTPVTATPDSRTRKLEAQIAQQEAEILKLRENNRALMNVSISANRAPGGQTTLDVPFYSAGQAQPQLRAI